MNYYIQGDPANADKIRAAFEKLGYDTSRHLFNAKSVLYFTLDDEIRATTCNCAPAIIKTHPDYKELELPIEPKFKVGDWLQSGSIWARIIRIDTEKRWYICDFDNVIPFEEQDSWSLVPNPKPHYDIANFYAGMPVLVRADNSCKWDYSVFSRVVDNEYWHFAVCNGVCFTQCIPFNNDTKHLLGTTDMCDEKYINW